MEAIQQISSYIHIESAFHVNGDYSNKLNNKFYEKNAWKIEKLLLAKEINLY